MTTIIELENEQTLGTIRGSINTNLKNLNAEKAELTQVLKKTNTTSFTPTLPYHPATKSYCDALETNWHAVYNPQGIAADVFALESMTGGLDPDQVDQDETHRFVTDINFVYWNQKEDAIGAKGTAFNKSFGTTTGTIATGNHTHTKTDIGLGNVDNTSDANKPISNLAQALFDTKEDSGARLTVDFDPQSAFPDYEKGRIFYDEKSQSLTYYADVADVAVNIGQEMLIRVMNRTGATISNGSACYQIGTEPPPQTGQNAIPLVDLALADTFTKATVLGIATHDIPHLGKGFLTRAGIVHDIDTSGLAIGQTIFLSSSVPGGFDSVAPKFLSRLGVVLVANSTSGQVLAKIENVVASPNVVGMLAGIAAQYDLSTSYQNIVAYSSQFASFLTLNQTTGQFTIPATGYYRASASFSLQIAATSASSRSVSVQVWNLTQSTGFEFYVPVPKNEGFVSGAFSYPALLANGDVIVLRIKSADAIQDVNFLNIIFDIQSIKLNGNIN